MPEKKKDEAKPDVKQILKLRSNFSELLLDNPNYFGNLPQFKSKPMCKILKDSHFEDISCVGFNQEQDLLYAVVRVKQDSGYNGNLCSCGSYEYVRFYVDWKGDGTFTDAGIASVNVHDIPGPKPISYCVTLKVKPRKKLCTKPYLVKVRAVLSWNWAPPSDQPNWDPVWGESEERWIQIKPRTWILSDLIKEAKIKFDPVVLENLDLESAVSAQMEYSIPELKALYKDEDVPEYRFNLLELANTLKKASVDANILALDPEMADGLSLAKKKELLALKKCSSVAYEEIRCAGLQYDTDTLSAVLTVKKPCGYNGDLCKKGSYEYVAFWADWNNNGTFDQYLGTVTVNVHDIPGIPPEGLQYAVTLPVNMANQKDLCHNPRIVRIRAILSWNMQPSTTNPNWNPYWGNKLDVLIQLKPDIPVSENQKLPFISSVGDIATMNIDNVTGLASGEAIIGGFSADESPFGGWVTICGHISNPPNITSQGVSPLRYQIRYRKDGDTNWISLNNKFRIVISRYNGLNWTQHWEYQEVDPDGYYHYKEDLDATDGKQQFVEGFVMSKWYTGGLSDGLYEIKIVVETGPGTSEETQPVKICLDNTPPVAEVSIDKQQIGNLQCAMKHPGDLLTGKFTATDEHFGGFSLIVLASGNPISPSNVAGTTGTIPANGLTGESWELDTGNPSLMAPCGYIVHLHVWDRTIVNSSSTKWHSYASEGFCLLPS